MYRPERGKYCGGLFGLWRKFGEWETCQNVRGTATDATEVSDLVTQINVKMLAEIQERFEWNDVADMQGNSEFKMMAFWCFKSEGSYLDRRHTLTFS